MPISVERSPRSTKIYFTNGSISLIFFTASIVSILEIIFVASPIKFCTSFIFSETLTNDNEYRVYVHLYY